MASLYGLFLISARRKNSLVLILFQHEGVHCNTVRQNPRLADNTYYGKAAHMVVVQMHLLQTGHSAVSCWYRSLSLTRLAEPVVGDDLEKWSSSHDPITLCSQSIVIFGVFTLGVIMEKWAKIFKFIKSRNFCIPGVWSFLCLKVHLHEIFLFRFFALIKHT